MMNCPSSATGPGRYLRVRRPVRFVQRALAFLLLSAAPVSGQWSGTVTVEETAGIRRTAFPAGVRFEVPEGRLGYVSQLRLMDDLSEVPSQGTAWAHWPDGSIRDVEVDFNVSIGPFEQRSFELQYGAEVTANVPSGRGLSVTETDRSFETERIRLNKGGSTLVASVTYREEIIDRGRNGLAVVERTGIRRDPREIRWEPVEMIKSGPLRVLARYRGTLALSGSEAEITLEAEMPNSKSWLKLSVTVSDPGAKIGDLGFETPFRLGDFPWTWDFGTANGTYGAFRDPTASTILTRTVDAAGSVTWEVRAGPAGSEQPYEVADTTAAGGSSTWAHLVGPEEAMAFAVEEVTGQPGTITVWMTGAGQTTVTFRSAEPTTEHAFSVIQHYVGTPVPIGAATSPASILNPLRVTIE
jgi:hypothetical protein